MESVAYVPEKFPFSTKDPELLEEINKVIKSYTTPTPVPEQVKGIIF